MVALAGSLYLISTAVFTLLAIAIGARLVVLSRRTGQAAEGALGAGILLTGGIGYGTMIVAMVGRQAAGGLDAPAIYLWISGAGWVTHNIGVMFMIEFVRRVFRPQSGWARALATAMKAVLWIGWLVFTWQGGLATGPAGSSFYWVAFAVIGTVPLWTAVESLRYWGLMRKRVMVGLADPLVANRFLLWAVASLCAAASIWIVNTPSFLGLEPFSDAARTVTTVSMLLTSAFGIGTICTYWLTFFPPAWYRGRFAAGTAGGEAA